MTCKKLHRLPTSALAIACVAFVVSCAPKVAAAPGNAGVNIAESGKSGAFDCRDGDATIAGMGHDVTLKNCRTVVVTGQDIKLTVKGDCTQFVLTGNDVEARLDSVGTISATGNAIRVTWRKALGGKAPQVSTIGNDVKVTQAR